MHYLKQSLLLVFFILFLVSASFAFDFSICETPERALAELGHDYYAYCERNIAPDYYSDEPELAAQQAVILPEDVFIPTTRTVNQSAQEINLSDLHDSSEQTPLTSAIGLSGLLFLLLVLGLVIWRIHHRHQHITSAIAKLLPTVKQYQEAGYTNEQIAQLLRQRGYEKPFINKLLRALEPKP